MKKILFSFIMIISISTALNAGFFSSMAGSVVANSITSSGRGATDDGSARTYFVILNKKVNMLNLEIKILLGTNALSLILLLWIFFRQRKYPQHNQLSKI